MNPSFLSMASTRISASWAEPSQPARTYICELEIKVHNSHDILGGVVFPTLESSFHMSRHPCQHMCATNGTNAVLKTMKVR
jgi:hypothetical protein